MTRWAMAVTCLALAACGGAPSSQTAFTPTGTLGTVRTHASGTDYLYVTSWQSNAAAAVLYFPVGSTGNVAPAGTITGPDTHLTSYSEGIVVNASGDIFVADAGTNSILEFPPASNGDVSPIAVIHGPDTGLAKPMGLAIDTAGDIYVANCSVGNTFGCPEARSGKPSIEEFAPGSNGDALPIRRIAGKRTHFFAPNSIALARNGDIYLLDSGNPPSPQSEIDVFGPRAHGNVAPKRVIAGSETMLDQAYGLVVSKHAVWAVTWGGQYLERFDLHANGNVAPVAVIKGSKTQLHGGLDGMALGSHDTIYVADRNNDQGDQSVQQYRGRANGNVAPLTQLSGSNTGFVKPLHLFVRTQR